MQVFEAAFRARETTNVRIQGLVESSGLEYQVCLVCSSVGSEIFALFLHLVPVVEPELVHFPLVGVHETVVLEAIRSPS